MGLLQKKPIVSSESIPHYSVGSHSLMLIFGLGNPEAKYDGTRHNVGFSVIDYFKEKHSEFSNWTRKKDLKLDLATATFSSNRVILAKPRTFMNNSGEAVQALQAFYQVAPSQTVVVYDELDLDFGQIRMRAGGGSAGHNGIKSIIEHSGDGFGRVRIGIASEASAKQDSASFVLKKFSALEKKHLPAL